MKKIIKYDLLNGSESIYVEIILSKNFFKCIEDLNLPFKHGKSFINPDIEVDKHETTVIKCFIPENERTKIINYHSESSMSICYKVIDSFIEKNWTNNEQLIELESLNCNHFEVQFKYLILS